MNDLLKQITDTITTYRSLHEAVDFNAGLTLNDLMRELSSDLFFLAKYQDQERVNYYATIYRLMHGEEQLSATKAEKIAKHLHPQKRQLDNFIAYGYRVLDAMRSNQSYLKQEK